MSPSGLSRSSPRAVRVLVGPPDVAAVPTRSQAGGDSGGAQYLHLAGESRRAGKASVARDENHVECFRKRDVHRVVGGEVVHEFRRSRQEWQRWVAREGQRGEVGYSVTKS